MLHESSRLGNQTEGKGPDPSAASQQVGTGQLSAGNGTATRRRCALCGKHYQVRDPRLLPFCSERCQQVDLGNWLGEAYGLPWEDPAGGESLPGADDDE
jgi:endogenous inhibitor of DNA gyrase (YacG/DUF329 family)